MVDNVAIIVDSCGKYSSVWDPFFKLFKIQWKDCKYKIYLNTEDKDYKCDFLNVTAIHTDKNKQWTEQLSDILKQIKEEYIIFLLEDFFFLNKVDEKKLDDILLEMMSKKKIGYVGLPVISLNNSKLNMQKKLITNNIYTRKQGFYWISATAAIWKKKFLYQMLYTSTNPWRFEKRACLLATLSNYKVCVVKAESNPFPYENNPICGYGIALSKWLNKNKELFEKYNIDVDYDELGCIDKTITWDDTSQKNNKMSGPTPTKRYILKHFSIKKYAKYYFDFKKYCRKIEKQK